MLPKVAKASSTLVVVLRFFGKNVSVNASLKDIKRFPPLLKFHLHLQFSKAIATVFNNKKRDIESHAF
jgi:hypothetical protein